MNKVTTLYAMTLLCLIALTSTYAQDIQRVRIDFKNPDSYVIHLPLGFTPDNSASDGMGYGYDALCLDEFDNHLSRMSINQRYVIQSVGEYQEVKSYNFGMFMANSGNNEISLNSLENFDNLIDVYVYGALSDNFHKINDDSFSNYINRFFITFQNTIDPNPSGQLSIDDYYTKNISIYEYYKQKRTTC